MVSRVSAPAEGSHGTLSHHRALLDAAVENQSPSVVIVDEISTSEEVRKRFGNLHGFCVRDLTSMKPALP